jgi:hypothetical protein
MSQAETVALWAGLIASIAGIVLSVVATVFAIWVGKQATEVNNQMIRSLQKIESTVEHLSADTRELITAGWNKMLTGLGSEREVEPISSDVPDKISEGIASEVRSELEDSEGQPTAQRLESVLADLRETLSAQLRQRPNRSSSDALDSLAETVRGLPVEARALLAILPKGRHLTRKEYLSSTRNPSLKAAVKALRAEGLLVPLEGADEDGKAIPVYWLPPFLSKSQVKLATGLAGDIPKEVSDAVYDSLRTIGYTPGDWKKRLDP